MLKEGLTVERRAFIRGFVKEVKVIDNEVFLSYTMPLIPDNLTMEKRGFYLPYSVVGLGRQFPNSCLRRRL